MKNLLLCAVFATLMTMPVAMKADVFASGIHFTNPDSSAFDGSVTDGTGLRIHFLLNDTASTVVLRIKNATTNTEINTITLTNQSKGWKTTVWTGTGAPGGSASYYAEITATQTPRSSTNYIVFGFIRTAGPDFAIFSRGVDVVRSQTSPNFGFIYASNAGGPLKRGFTRYAADGQAAGTNPGNPILTPALSTGDGGTIPWSVDASAPIHATTDNAGRIYASDFPSGEIWRMDNNSTPPKRIIKGLVEPKGLAAVGSGAGLKLYICAGTYVLRANLGTSDTLSTPLDTVASLGKNVRDVIFDDGGSMYVNLRDGTGFDGTSGLATEKYVISGTLPVTRANVIWLLAVERAPHRTGSLERREQDICCR